MRDVENNNPDQNVSKPAPKVHRVCFEIEGLPKMPNQLLGAPWQARAQEARYWKRYVWAMVSKQKPKEPFARARVTLTRFSSQEPDRDGLRGSFKHVLDGLVYAGVLKDDSPAIIGEPAVKWEKVPAGFGRIQVIVDGIE